MPATDRRYVAIGVHWTDAPDKPEFLAVEGKIVLVDTLNMARELLPRLGGAGRVEHWDATREICCFTPLFRKGYNRLTIWTGYDPYDVPNGLGAKGVRSEAEGIEWRWHVYWNHVRPALFAWADQLTLEPVNQFLPMFA